MTNYDVLFEALKKLRESEAYDCIVTLNHHRDNIVNQFPQAPAICQFDILVDLPLYSFETLYEAQEFAAKLTEQGQKVLQLFTRDDFRDELIAEMNKDVEAYLRSIYKEESAFKAAKEKYIRDGRVVITPGGFR